MNRPTRPGVPERPRPAVPNAVLGTMIFILTEIMLFAGFISAHTIARSSVAEWPPPGQPRLPIETTAITTLALLVSGALMFWAGRRFKIREEAARWPMAVAVLLGVFFLAFQGFEWVQLINEGLSHANNHGGFFYLLVGAHGLHVLGGVTVMVLLFARLQRGTLDGDAFWAGRLFWYFVVLLWPVLYYQVYL